MNSNPNRRRFYGTLSLILTAFLMAFAIWAIAVNATDPLEKRIFPNPIPLEVLGLDQNLAITSSIPQNVELILTAPQSTWSYLINGSQPVKATLNLAALSAGQYDLDINLQIEARAVRIENYSPRSIHVILEPKIH